MKEKKYDQKQTEQIIMKYIFEKLGKPKDLNYFKCVNLWSHYFRINIYCSKNKDILVRANEITDSFFIKFLNGNVESCSPDILEKKYN